LFYAVKSAYKKASLRYHPDRAKEADRDKAKMMFQAMYKAYEVLSDTDRRQIYDETGRIVIFIVE
jgi:DnaJ family protein C protein 9